MEDQDIAYIQEKVNVAYEKWQGNESWSYKDFLFTLDFKEKVAVLIGNLNYQVENGGFLQWHDNDYSSEVDQLILALDRYKIHKPVEAVLNIVKEASKIIKEETAPKSRSFYDSYDEDDEDDYEELYSRLSPLDDEYDKVNEQFMIVMNDLLKKE